MSNDYHNYSASLACPVLRVKRRQWRLPFLLVSLVGGCDTRTVHGYEQAIYSVLKRRTESVPTCACVILTRRIRLDSIWFLIHVSALFRFNHGSLNFSGTCGGVTDRLDTPKRTKPKWKKNKQKKQTKKTNITVQKIHLRTTKECKLVSRRSSGSGLLLCSLKVLIKVNFLLLSFVRHLAPAIVCTSCDWCVAKLWHGRERRNAHTWVHDCCKIPWKWKRRTITLCLRQINWTT